MAGSPPRGRGKGGHGYRAGADPRITPAWAGKRAGKPPRVRSNWDHPRVGGEKSAMANVLFSQRGSPPRGRGKEAQARPQERNTGITPAWAGKRGLAILLVGVLGDHPRVGGEKLRRQPCLGAILGSPPRGRGKEPICSNMFCRFGITPAWAGKSQIESYGTTSNEDHPRVGGEKTKKIP